MYLGDIPWQWGARLHHLLYEVHLFISVWGIPRNLLLQPPLKYLAFLEKKHCSCQVPVP